ncbi:hypothetical protein ACP26L_19455 [Paenibacillus sp. S-38]|uniref:hypothetical protein n=1 Tax=Paenibacillus sp. S-38 TaxID=3416710 RepID=UPI003CF04A27
MKNEVHWFYCCRCCQLEPLGEALKVFSSGYMRQDSQDYRVGYCLGSEFLLQASTVMAQEGDTQGEKN